MNNVETFNNAAFAQTYVDANDYVADDNFFSQAFKNISGHGYAANIDVDATIRNAQIDTTLNAIVAGDPSLQEFVDVIHSYPDVKESLGRVLADEGQAGLEGFQELMTGDGAIGTADFEQMMANDIHRGLVVEMLDAVATEQHDMDYAKRFVQGAMTATREGATAEERDAFMEVAAEAGIDPTAPYKQQAQAAFLGFFGNVIQGGDVTQSMNALKEALGGMGVSPEALQSLENLLAPLAGIMQYLIEPYAEFYQKWSPTIAENVNGMVTDVQNVMEGMNEIGTTATDRALSGTDPAGTEQTELETELETQPETVQEHAALSPGQQALNDISAQANEPGYMQGASNSNGTGLGAAIPGEMNMQFASVASGIIRQTPEWVQNGPNNDADMYRSHQQHFGIG